MTTKLSLNSDIVEDIMNFVEKDDMKNMIIASGNITYRVAKHLINYYFWPRKGKDYTLNIPYYDNMELINMYKRVPIELLNYSLNRWPTILNKDTNMLYLFFLVTHNIPRPFYSLMEQKKPLYNYENQTTYLWKILEN